jgi:hypothetical protein
MEHMRDEIHVGSRWLFLACLGDSVVQDDVQQGTVHFQPVVVIDETQPPELVHERADPRSGCPDHFRKRLLADSGDHFFVFTIGCSVECVPKSSIGDVLIIITIGESLTRKVGFRSVRTFNSVNRDGSLQSARHSLPRLCSHISRIRPANL